MVRVACVVLALLAAPLLAQPQRRPPVASVARGAVQVTLPEHILDRAEVRRQMGSALTTTFVLVARARNATPPPRSRIEIRFDLWDEVYLVRRIEMGRITDERRIDSIAGLRKWWSTPLHLLDVANAPATVDLQLIVLPFSAAEEGDARDWLEKSGGIGTEQSPGAGIVGAMIGTTIQARPIATLHWTLTAEERR